MFAASAGIILAGSGLASAADTGSASLSADATGNVAAADTGSSAILADLIKALNTGSASGSAK